MTTRSKLATGAVVLAGCSFAGGAYAATNDTSPKQAFLNDVASRLHISPAQLKSALRGAALDQLQAAVKAGRLTQAQANAIERRMRDHGGLAVPFFGFRRLRHLDGGPLTPAARYLGITEIQLLDQLASGKSLAQLATAHGKTAAGLENALVGAARSKLNRLRANGFITGTQEQRALSRLQARITELVNRAGLRPRFGARLLPPPPGALMPAPAGPPPFAP